MAEADAINEIGFFGNQNTVAKPKSEKWEHTGLCPQKAFLHEDAHQFESLRLA
ncbi:MAG: Uncharacterised protein [Cellulomonadaceae bacterium TMED98]|nr:MAG: Uncharacterised protein [Cellulomonadaceae bacterium TMED98]